MIIGNGLLGSSFRQVNSDLLNQVIVFASGVSNSSEVNPSAFARELNLLENYLQSDDYIVYFGTCSIYDDSMTDSLYVRHKLKIENILYNRGKSLIVRLPQVVGRSENYNTLVNFLYKKILNQEYFEAWANARRYLIDVEHVVDLTLRLLESSRFDCLKINLAPPVSISIYEIINFLEFCSGKSARFKLINKGFDYLIDTSSLNSLIPEAKSIFHDLYYKNLFLKYYVF